MYYEFCSKKIWRSIALQNVDKMWLDVNKLALNIDKTKFVIFKSSQHSSPVTVSIKIGNLPIRKACYIKFLDVLLDENLSWKYHLTELSKKLARTCDMFFKVGSFYPLTF